MDNTNETTTKTRKCACCGAKTTNAVLPPYSGWFTGKALCGGKVCAKGKGAK